MNNVITRNVVPEYVAQAFEAFKKSEKEKGNDISELAIGKLLTEAGGFSDIYEIKNGNEPLVLKVVDTFDVAFIKQGRNMSPEYVCKRTDFEITAMERCNGCANIMPLRYFYKHEINAYEFHYVYLLIMPKYQNVFDLFCGGKSVTEKDLYQLIIGISNALICCKNKNILHRDVKLPNIYVRNINGSNVYILGDFGIAKDGVKREIFNGVERPYTRFANSAPEVFMNVECDYNYDVYLLCKAVLDFAKERVNLSNEFKNLLEHGTEKNPIDRLHIEDLRANAKYLFEGEESDLNHIPPAPSPKIDPTAYQKKSKAAILQGDYETAKQYALVGHKLNLPSCSRLYAYALWKTTPIQKDFETSGGKILDILIKDKDVIAKGLRGIINIDYAIKNKRLGAKEDYKMIEEAAVDGCVFAAHYYGRWLFDGNAPGLPCDKRKGLDILFGQALKEDYAPSLIYLKKIFDKDGGKCIKEHSPIYEKMLLKEIENRNLDESEPNFYRKPFIFEL